MESYNDISVYALLLKGDSFGEWVYDDEGKINNGKPFVIYTDTVRAFMDAVEKKEQKFETVLEKSREGALKGEAEKEVAFALLKSVVGSEKYAPGTVLSRLKDGTIQSILSKL